MFNAGKVLRSSEWKCAKSHLAKIWGEIDTFLLHNYHLSSFASNNIRNVSMCMSITGILHLCQKKKRAPGYYFRIFRNFRK